MIKEFIKPLKIANVTLENNVLLAPLAGVTDIAFRQIAKSFGAGLTYTEMISAKGLNYSSEKTFDLLKTARNEKPKAVQIFGSDAQIMSEMVKIEELQHFDVIDINMGCPVRKVISNGDGSALMKDIKKAESIIKKCVKNSNKPITVKFRKGFDDNSINAVEFAKMCEASGAELITIHGRTARQMYGGFADRKIMEQVKKAVSISVVGNGDIFDLQSAKDVFETGVDGIMIARGALGRPWFFEQLLKGEDVNFDLKKVILNHIQLMANYFDERYAVVNMRKHILWYVKGMKNASSIKNEVVKKESMQELVEFIDKCF